MKKRLLISISLLMTIFSYSQISLEKTVSSSKRIQFLKLENGSTKYYTFNNFEIKIYNSNHSIYKTINIDENSLNFPSAITTGSDNLLIVAVSEKIFDNDEEIEFLFYAYARNNPNSSTDYSYTEKTFIINEDGSILFEVTNQSPPFSDDDYETVQNPWWIKNTENGIKMILTNNRHESDNGRESYIYSLPGTATLALNDNNKLEDLELKAYPNPSSEYVNLKYNLPKKLNNGKVLVYNINGIKVKEYNIDNHTDTLKLTNEDLSAGTYLYSVVAGNYKSKTLKLVIQ